MLIISDLMHLALVNESSVTNGYFYQQMELFKSFDNIHAHFVNPYASTVIE